MTVPTAQSSWNRAVASHRLFRQSDEAKTWTHRCRLHGANVLSHSDDAFVPTKAVSVCANQRSLNGSACLKTPAEQTSVYSSRESPILNLFCHSCRRTDAHFIRLFRQMRSSRADVFRGRPDDALGLTVRL